MSEEVLQALMQLFAIIANQDGGSNKAHNDYVQKFLISQISGDRIKEFVDYYNSFIKPPEEGEQGKPKLTSMKDSVRTLAICKKINKTLNQKQKIIVFARLIEFIEQDKANSQLRNEIIKTVSEVFNITGEEFKSIQLLFTENYSEYTPDFLLVRETKIENDFAKQIQIPGFQGTCVFLYLAEHNLIVCKFDGDAEIFLNGLVIKPNQLYLFSPGSSIRHAKGTIFYSDIITKFLNESFTDSVSLIADINEHRHPNGKKALHSIYINENSGSLIGIMGASGSGKTTLLNVLSGNDKLSDGTILINGEKVSHENKEIHGVIGFIPQDDLLIEELTVFQNLYFSAQLCFKGISAQELNLKVSKSLNSLGLYEVKDVVVGNPLNKKISGGQRKRLNIALELIREPQILFVDEPTSGLSSKDSENVMDLLKELTQKGKLIFVVIHQPSSDIYKLFDKIFLLDVGGHPIYYGNPVEAVMYFKKNTNQINSDIGECHSCGSVNPELIFNLIESKEVDEYGNYTNKRKIGPAGWYDLFKANFPLTKADLSASYEKLKKLLLPNKVFQWRVFLKRDTLSKLANKQYLLINLLEVPALAVLLATLIRYTNYSKNNGEYSYNTNDNIPAYFFMSILVALLVGLTVSAEEIYKDQKILKRERFLKLSRMSYLLSKIVILFTLSLVQAFLLCAVGNLILEVPGNFLSLYFMVFSVFCSANIIGLILSSTFNSPVTIYIIIPLIIIPQMLLGGAMFRFSKINSLFGGSNHDAPPISATMVSRWAYEAIIVEEFKNNQFEKNVFTLDKIESNLSYKLSYVFPKIEELKEIRVERDTLLTAAQKDFIDSFTKKNIDSEFKLAEKKYGKINLKEEEDSLAALKVVIIEKYNFIINKKDSLISELLKKNITKEKYTNESIDETVTNSLEKEKIVIDSSMYNFIEVIDPVFQDPDENAVVGLNSHMFSVNKKIGNVILPTYTYNLIVIWLINIIGFFLLYFDVFKKVFSISFKK
ncbi:MAG: ATP-binding cassette domain-containing protein [Bacteroidota bacterium]|nr:ATP-binding cassette domain-containing protein [Bacteroidota bacterium]